MRATGCDIGPVRDAAEAALVGDWIYDQWGRHEPSQSRAQCREQVAASLGAADLPKFFLCRRGDELIGCSSIVAADLPTMPDLGPWLANVYVRPADRRRGIAAALIAAALSYADSRWSVLYLYTHDLVDYYKAKGWEAFDEAEYAGQHITIMTRRSRGSARTV